VADFDWDFPKYATNIIKHGITFDEAKSVFQDPGRMEMPDLTHSIYEPRIVTIGWSDQDRLLAVITSERNTTLRRIISARRATKRERHEHERRRR
jgi:uncharacterized DUF497 family protein